MNCLVVNQDGQPVPNANWGDTDLSGINMRRYPHVDVSDRATVSGYTGPRYVQDGLGGIGDVQTGRTVSPQAPPVAGYCPRQAEIDEHNKLCHELTAQR